MSFSSFRPLARIIRTCGATGLVRRNASGGESAKSTFQKLFPRVSGSAPKPKYQIDSYGQSVGAEYPFEHERTPENRLKREKSKGKVGAASVDLVLKILEKNTASDVKVIEVPDDKRYADFIVVGSGADTKHLQKMTHDLCSVLITSLNTDSVHVEGLGSHDWMVVDAGSVVVHLFLPHMRQAYNIEEAWEE